MKWKIILSGLLVLSLFLQSCALLKKTKTITETITVTKVDTIIKVVKDTVLKTVSVTLYDTAKIETEISNVRSYYDIKTQKIKLELKNKPFNVPVQLQKTQFIKQKEVVNSYDKSFYVMFGFFFLMILFFVLYHIKENIIS